MKRYWKIGRRRSDQDSIGSQEDKWPSQEATSLQKASWEREKYLKKLQEPINNKLISQEAFDALLLAQGMINEAKQILLYGSWTQEKDLLAKFAHDDTTESNGQVFQRTEESRFASDELTQTVEEAKFKSTGMSWNALTIALRGGMAAHFKAGNCSEHARLTYALLIKYGYPGLKIYFCTSKLEDHEFVIVEGTDSKGKVFKVACDAWPAHDPQAVLWEDHRSIYKKGKDGINYNVVARHEITPENMGEDIFEKAFSAIDDSNLRSVTKDITIKEKYNKDELARTIFENHEVSINDLPFNVPNTLDNRFQSYVAPDGRKFVKDGLDQDKAKGTNGKDEATQDTIGLKERWSLSPTLPLRQVDHRHVAELNTETDIDKQDRSQLLDLSQPSEEFLHRRELEREIREVEKLAKAKGKTQPCQYKTLEEIRYKLGKDSQVILKSTDGTRAYIKHTIPGQSSDHWEIALVTNRHAIALNEKISTYKKISELKVRDKIKGGTIHDADDIKRVLAESAKSKDKRKFWGR